MPGNPATLSTNPKGPKNNAFPEPEKMEGRTDYNDYSYCFISLCSRSSDVLCPFKKEIVGYRLGIAQSQLHVQVATSAVWPKGQVPAK
jgi:hypothetical protein